MKTLYHLATDAEGKPKNAYFVDGNGLKYTVPYDDPTEIQSDWIANKIVEHCHYYGIVIIHTHKTRTGIEYDMDDARQRAEESLLLSEKTCIQEYIYTQLEDRVRQNFPPLPPQGRALECVVKHKYNLLKAGIRCIGWEPPYHMEDPGFGNTPASAPNSAMFQEQITAMQAQMLQMNQMIMQLMTGKIAEASATAAGKKNKGGKPGGPGPVEHESEPTEPVESVTL